jgi:hypothetical protein
LENLVHNLVKLFWRTVEEASKPGQADPAPGELTVRRWKD